MRITPALALSIILGCGSLRADTVSYRCVEAGKQTNPETILLVTVDPLLGEMKAERYSGNLRSRMTYQIDALNEATIRGRYVLPILGITMVLELDRIKGRADDAASRGEPVRRDDNPEVFKTRLGVYREQTAPVTEYYRSQGLLNVVDGLQPIDAVTEQLAAALAAVTSDQIRSDVR